jgi:acyl-coenzyme A thioesterase PaaI-like protein
MKIPKSIRSILPIPDLAGDISVIRKFWDTLKSAPQGKHIYSRIVNRMIPYTGTIRSTVEEIGPGHAVVSMQDRHGVRNHIKSVHAIALANLAEYAGNTAVAYSLEPNSRFIVSGMTMEYLKKARGTITAEGTCPPSIPAEKKEYIVEVVMRDPSGDVVARSTLTTLVGPTKKKN